MKRGGKPRRAVGSRKASCRAPAKRNAPWDRCETIGPVTLYQGDCRAVLPALAADGLAVEACVTDPPYELGLLGKDWDRSGVAFDAAAWRLVLDCLKPGGHLLAFGAARTYHRLACAIEDAGADVRDQLMWLYGSGQPKSLDVAREIDATDGIPGQRHDDLLRFTSWMRGTGITARQINEATASHMASHYLTAKSQPAVPTADKFDLLRPHLPKRIPKWVQAMVDDRTALERRRVENLARRTVTGQHKATSSPGGLKGKRFQFRSRDITEAFTPAARAWSGWGSALRPSHEPIVMARKPFAGTLAGCVLDHGAGAINVGACRIDGERWPANVVTDGSLDVLELLPPSAREAIRFFYAAKASQAERNAGAANDHPTVKPISLMSWLCRLVTRPGGQVLDPFMGSGSTGIAAVQHGLRFVGIEQRGDAFATARARIAHALDEMERAPTIEHHIAAGAPAVQLSLLDGTT